MRDGSRVGDSRLGRVASFDPRSRGFAARALAPPDAVPVRRTWRLGVRLNQGDTPACVGHAWAHDHAAEPGRHAVKPRLAFDWYDRAQTLDEWAGSDYAGTSTLGGAKAGVSFGFFREYRWCFSLDDYILTVGHLGPVVVGTNWYESMFRPGASGTVRIAGSVAGGHEWLIRGVEPDRNRFHAANSWGPGWGAGGDFFISFADFDRLRREGGDGCYPVRA